MCIINIERGDKSARRPYRTGIVGPKWEGGRPTGGDDGQAGGYRENISSGRGCASLQRGVPERYKGSDREQRKWYGLASSTSRMVRTGV